MSKKIERFKYLDAVRVIGRPELFAIGSVGPNCSCCPGNGWCGSYLIYRVSDTATDQIELWPQYLLEAA